jgi:CRISPR-associated protein (Cas_Cmr5)
MQNLEQIRARNALTFADKGFVRGEEGGEVIKKVSPLIQNHGLLATAAYSFTEKTGWQKVFDAIAQHLADKDIGIVAPDCTDREQLMKFLTRKETTSETLKLATAETMAWLTYARRFVKSR